MTRRQNWIPPEPYRRLVSPTVLELMLNLRAQEAISFRRVHHEFGRRAAQTLKASLDRRVLDRMVLSRGSRLPIVTATRYSSVVAILPIEPFT